MNILKRVCQRKQFVHHLQIQPYGKWTLPSTMKCFVLNEYAETVDKLQYETVCACPTEKELKPDQVLIKVHAASVNPFDIEMSNGYGRSALNLFRRYAREQEFPLILGRDCSGVIVKRGKRFRRFQEGDSVWCVRWITGQGSHAEYVIADKNEVSLKPKNLDHIEATALPYVACTTWNALINSKIVPTKGRKKRIFIPGGTGGIGSFACQLCQSFGHDVVTSCSHDGTDMLQKLGLKNVINYTSATYEEDLKSAGPFDVVFDTLNERYKDFFQTLLRPSPLSSYISLRPSLLPDTDKHGILFGTLNAGGIYVQSSVNQLFLGRGYYYWGFFNPNALFLDEIKPLVENGQILPVIDKVFSIDHVLDAYKYVEEGHARGKTVIQMNA